MEKIVSVELNEMDVGLICDAIQNAAWKGTSVEKVVLVKVKMLGTYREFHPELFDEKGELKLANAKGQG